MTTAFGIEVPSELPGFGPRYTAYLEEVRKRVRQALADAPEPAQILPFFERGKGLRALVTLAAAEAATGEVEPAFPAAEAIELLHGAAIFHDDIIDEAAQRRGLTALHVQAGLGSALVLGDYVMLLAFSRIGRAAAELGPARCLRAMEVLNECARECCRGQVQELLTSQAAETEEEYERLVAHKTGAQFVAAAVLGAILGGAPEAHVAALREYATNLGVAFQIRDDVLDLEGRSDLLGKPVGNSLAHGRPMLPLILLRKATGRPVPRWGSGEDSTRSIVRLLRRHGVLAQIERMLEVRSRRAIAALEALEASEGRKVLEAIADYATRRDR
jgi:geranylgeranyl pyrophosphate synthase